MNSVIGQLLMAYVVTGRVPKDRVMPSIMICMSMMMTQGIGWLHMFIIAGIRVGW